MTYIQRQTKTEKNCEGQQQNISETGRWEASGVDSFVIYFFLLEKCDIFYRMITALYEVVFTWSNCKK